MKKGEIAVKKLTEADQAAIRMACQKAIDLDLKVRSCARQYGISEEAVRLILEGQPVAAPGSLAATKLTPSKPTVNPEFDKAFDPVPLSPKKPGRPKGSRTKTEAPVSTRKPRKTTGHLDKLRAAMAGLTTTLEDVDRYLPLSEGEKAVIQGYFTRLQYFESGVAFAEGSYGKGAPDGSNQG